MVGTDSPPDPLATPPRVDDPRRVTNAELAEVWATLERQEQSAILNLIAEGREVQRRLWVAVHAEAIRAEMKRRGGR